MGLTIPPELKKIKVYILRAEELDKDKSSAESRIVAYYARQYAVTEGIPMLGSSSAAKTCLQELLDVLEKEKEAMSNFTRDEAAYLCREFAEKVFNRADEEDRAGNADKKTARAFYASATFIQILAQFYNEDGSDAPIMEEDRKRIIYAKWKSTEILKAIKEGRQPTPGGYGESAIPEDEDENPMDSNDKTVSMKPAVETVSSDDDADGLPLPPPIPPTTAPAQKDPEPETTSSKAESEEEEEEQEIEVTLGPPPPAYPGSQQQVDRPPVQFDLPPAVAAPPVPKSTEKKKTGMFGLMKKSKKAGKPSKAEIADATELARFAVTALEDKEVELAVERLHQALDLLQ